MVKNINQFSVRKNNKLDIIKEIMVQTKFELDKITSNSTQITEPDILTGLTTFYADGLLNFNFFNYVNGIKSTTGIPEWFKLVNRIFDNIEGFQLYAIELGIEKYEK